MITIQYNDAMVLVKKEDLLKINYFSYMFEFNQTDKIIFNHSVGVKYFELLLSFVDNNDIIYMVDYDILGNMLELSIYLDYQYFIDKLKSLPYDYSKVNDVNKLYQVYLQTDRLEELYTLLNNLTIPELDINAMSLLQYYDLSLHKHKTFELFEHRYKLNYETPLPFYKTYQSNCVTTYEYKNILTKEEFNETFKQQTNHVFGNFDWSNVCIAGGFLFGLINQACHSLLKTSDIDLYIYHSEEDVRKKTWEYVLSYFNAFNAKYYDDHGLVMIELEHMKFTIQIIIMNYDKPEQILNSFDMNYCKLYYQGNQVYADIGCLVAFKHQVAICDTKFVKTIDTRIYKTIKKGLRLMKNKDIEKYTTLLKNDILNLDLYDLSLLDKYNYKGKYMDYKDLVWYNHCHTMKLYTLNQGYGDKPDDKKHEEYDTLFLPNVYLDKIDISQLKMKLIDKIGTMSHYRYEYQNQLINLVLEIKHDDVLNHHLKHHDDIRYHIKIKVTEHIKQLVNNYLQHFNFKKTRILTNNSLFLHLYQNNLKRIWDDRIKNKQPMKLVTQLIAKETQYHPRVKPKPHLKFTLIDII